ncbi:MAG: hypothetical protein OXH70_09385 [Acidobacteria bacterium]|nr:hypothetical protein [Acidobacteriota bacterium]
MRVALLSAMACATRRILDRVVLRVEAQGVELPDWMLAVRVVPDPWAEKKGERQVLADAGKTQHSVAPELARARRRQKSR